MKLFEQNKKILTLKKRATALTIAKDIAALDFEPSGETDSGSGDRKLLDIEITAQEKKAVEDSQVERYKQNLSIELHRAVKKSVNDSLADSDSLFSTLIKTEPELGKIFDVLSLRAASIKKILKIVKDIPWLCNDLIELVNKPQYRKNNDVKFNDVNLALSYLGLDNLQRLLPPLIFKHFLPATTRPFATMRRRLWANALGNALSAEALAEYNKQPMFLAYASAYIANLPDLFITRLFLNSFDFHQEASLKEAYKEKDKKRYNLMAKLTPDHQVLITLLQENRLMVAKALVAHFAPERLPLAALFENLEESEKFNDLSAMAKILVQAQAYIDFKHLNTEKLITSKEALSLLSAAKLRQEHVELLKNTNTSKLRLHQETKS